MAPAEMIQTKSLLSIAQPSTPPSSPIQSSHEHVVTLGDAQQVIDMVKAIVAMHIELTPPLKCSCSHTPPESPSIQASAPPVTLQDIKELILMVIEAKSRIPAELPECPKSDAIEVAKKVVAQTLKPEYKKVDEIWVEKEYKYKIVESLQLPHEADDLNGYVFVVRGRIDKKTADTIFYIDVKSELLRDVLRTTLKNAHSVVTNGNKLSIEQNVLYHYLPELESCQSWNSIDFDGKCAAHVGLLVDYIKATYKDVTQDLTSLLENNEITYDLLWTMFKPNVPVFTTCHGTHKPRCVKYDFGQEKTSKSGSKYWNIECRYQDFDSKEFGNVPIELQIPKFRGVKRINLLEAFPLHYHSDFANIKAKLIQNGQKFVSLIGSHYRQYQGTAFFIEKGQPVEFSVNGRVMIDAAFFSKVNPNYARLKITEPADSIPVIDLWDLCVFGDDHQDGREPSMSQAGSHNIELTEMTEDDLLICCPTMPGFSFGDKQWDKFSIDNIEDIQWSSEPFDCLAISEHEREVIMALVEARSGCADQESDFAFDDFVAGKGRGLNVLLHGPPGVGKTLTAEAAAEHLKRPLYSISAGELSTNAAELEAQLCRIFQIASHWGAVLLLDEADVYLEQRSTQDLIRNGLVSVFLRKLEYCDGIMFLTTNRVSQFDVAILSRMHLTLRYDDLDKKTRECIWTQFLDKARTAQGATTISPAVLKRLVAHKFNGREIKNIIATSHALATRQKGVVLPEHLDMAVLANVKFADEFFGKDKMDSLYS